MKNLTIILLASLLAACGRGDSAHEASHDAHGGHEGEAAAEEPAKGPNNGRLLTDGPFTIELAIFETGVPPEYHAWPTLEGKPVPLDQVKLVVTLTRLGGKQDVFQFARQENYLRGNGVVTEPHSFTVKVVAEHAGQRHEWSYDSLEGRTTIADNIAAAAGIKTETAGPATLVETVTLYGRVIANPNYQRDVSARFPGLIRSVQRNVGDRVRQGDGLALIESNESLQTYTLRAPISGVVTARNANAGEQSGSDTLFTVTDTSQLMAELAVFPRDRVRVKRGARVRVKVTDSDTAVDGTVERLALVAGADQSIAAFVRLENRAGALVAGSFVTGDVAVSERKVPLAVKTSALQPFRDFTVVYERVGDTYEVRMLELGTQYGEWVEVLGGLEAGAQYVTQNSYVLKADVEKSGASHDH